MNRRARSKSKQPEETRRTLVAADVAGVLLIAGGLFTALALWRDSGLVLGWYGQEVRLLFGTGAPLFALALILAGWFLFAQPNDRPIDIQVWQRLLGGEMLLVLLLALWHGIRATNPLQTDDLPAGVIGWLVFSAPATLIGVPATLLLYALLALLLLLHLLPLETEDVQARLQAWRTALRETAQRWRTPPQPITVPPAPIETPATPPTPNDAEAPSQPTKPTRKNKAQRPAPQEEADDVPPLRTRRPHPRDLPPLDLLHDGEDMGVDMAAARARARLIEETLAAFGVPAQVVQINPGPTVTQFGIKPGFIERRLADGTVKRTKVRVSKITSLADDLALALSAKSIRVEAPVPGRPYVGIEVPNSEANLVSLKGILTSEEFTQSNAEIPFALGRDVSGNPVVADLTKMPHLLIAGATGSGKSVCINAIIACLLFNFTPDDLRLLLVDPKMVELIPYNGIPHLISPVLTDVEKVVGALRWALAEMDRRYKLFSQRGKRNLQAYNAWAERAGEETLPYLVIIIDELADLMMVAPDEVERMICRLAQMARATGIHLIIATQRPSVDVVTGLIKANFPARIAFAVASSIDSRVILDAPGAETLLGRGDMLFMAPDSSKLQRLQGAFISDEEINALVTWWRTHVPQETIAQPEVSWDEFLADSEMVEEDELLPTAIDLVQEYEWVSTSFLQRKLRIGYNRAARLMDLLEERGIVGPPDDKNRGSRPVLRGRSVDDEFDDEDDIVYEDDEDFAQPDWDDF
ncbi:DNA translocase FtsK [Ardenticatena maritima]|nr:DNA translocase FtsK [Ardenticatena maritima]